MTDRGLPMADGAPACPFVAYSDDRDARSTSPDHRHRCFAESPPAPRALAHQEAYCLSSAFPVCPTFQEWARREAARADSAARPADGGSSPGMAAAAAAGGAAGAAAAAGASAGPSGEMPPSSRSTAPGGLPASAGAASAGAASAAAGGSAAALGETPGGAARATQEGTPTGASAQRDPPRDWAAPPPWATGPSPGLQAPPADSADVPAFLVDRSDPARGLAGSTGDVLAGAPPGPASSSAGAAGWSASAGATLSAAPDDELAGLVGGARPGSSGPPPDEPGRVPPPVRPPPPPPARAPQVSSTRPRQVQPAPSWSRGRRYDAYPAIGRRNGWPGVSRVVLFAGALAIAALALFFLPALLGIGGGGSSSPSASASGSGAVSSSVPSPTAPPAPTQQVYVVKSGDTMSRLARQFALTVDELCNANKTTIKDCNKLAIGDQLVIPTAAPQEFTNTPAPSPS